MRLFYEEIKKLWRWPVVMAIVAANLLLFYMLLSDQLNYSYNETGEQIVIADLRGMVGDTLEPGELPEAYRLLERYYADAAAIMQSDPSFAEAGLSGGEELWTVVSTLPGELAEEAEARYQLQMGLAGELEFGKYLEPSDYAFWKIQALTMYLKEYEHFETREFANNLAVTMFGASVERLEAYAEADAHRNIFSSRSYSDTVNLFSMCVLITVISVGILLLPYLTVDNQRGITQMQWSAKAGRRTIKVQLAAAMISAGMLTIILFVVYFSLFLAHRPEYIALMERPVFTVLGYAHALLYNPLFWQLVCITAGLCTAYSIGASGIFFFLSRHSADYVSELLKAVPIGAAVAGLGVAAIFRLFSEQNPVSGFLRLPGAEFLAVGLVLLTGIGLCAATLRRELTRELL